MRVVEKLLRRPSRRRRRRGINSLRRVSQPPLNYKVQGGAIERFGKSSVVLNLCSSTIEKVVVVGDVIVSIVVVDVVVKIYVRRFDSLRVAVIDLTRSELIAICLLCFLFYRLFLILIARCEYISSRSTGVVN